MKNLKLLGLCLMALASLMAFAGSAPGATFTAPANTEYTGEFDISLEPGTSELTKAGFAEITCTSATWRGTITLNDDTEASGPITQYFVSTCGSSTVDNLSKGSLTILKSNTEIRLIGNEETFSALGTSCVYGGGASPGTKLGTATNTASGVTLNVSAALPKISGGFLCASPATWTAKLIFTTPSGSVVD
jgi:hypothetical protein